MDAEETLAFLRQQNREEVTLESGRRYTIRRPDVMRLMAFGDIPLPALKDAAAAEANGATETEDDSKRQLTMQAMYDFNDRILAEGIEQIDGTDVEMTREAVRLIPEDEREELLEYLKREKTSPKAGSPA